VAQIVGHLRNAFPEVEFPMGCLLEKPTIQLLSTLILEDQNAGPSFSDSMSRAQKRKKRKHQRMMPEKRMQFHEEFKNTGAS
jgi:hypothetical protein